MRERSSHGSCGWGPSGGGGQSSCENTSVGGEGSPSHGAFPPEADGYIIVSTQEPHRFVSAALGRGGGGGSPLPEQKGRSLPPKREKQQVGRGELLQGQRPPRNQTGWIPEKDRTGAEASGHKDVPRDPAPGGPPRRRRGGQANAPPARSRSELQGPFRELHQRDTEINSGSDQGRTLSVLLGATL